MKWTLVLLGIWIQTSCWTQSHLALIQPSLKNLRIGAPTRTTQYANLPLQVINKLTYVEAEIDGEKGVVIIDTGSPDIIVNRKVEGAGTSLPVATVSAQIDLQSVVIKYLRLGAVEQRNLDGLAFPFGSFGSGAKEKVLGLVGYSFFKDYETLFDYENQRLHLFPAGNVALYRTARPVKQIKFSPEGHLPVITLEIGDRKLRFGLDTGAANNIIDAAHLNDLPDALLRILPMEQMRCLDGPYQDVEAAVISHLTVDGYPLQPMKFLFADLSKTNANTEDQLDGLLGYPFFSQLLCSINYRTKTLSIWERKQDGDTL